MGALREFETNFISGKGKSSSRQYAFDDFSERITLTVPKIRKVTRVPKQKKVKPYTHTYIFTYEIGCIVLKKQFSQKEIIKRFPTVKEYYYGLNDEVFSKLFKVRK